MRLLLVIWGACSGELWGTAAMMTIVNQDGAGEGLNDPTPATPVGGNNGTTVGQQRLVVFQRAAELWGAKVTSAVTIQVGARFDPLDCTATSGTLGSAGPFTFFRDFVGAPRAGTYYAVALANAYAGRDLDPGNVDIVATFNSDVGATGCLASAKWYYGLDGNTPANAFNLLEVVLHEMAHGLGFSTLVDRATGAKPNGYDDTFSLHLEDHSTGKMFPEMTNAERLTAMTDNGDLHWTGSDVVGESGLLTAGKDANGHVRMYAPSQLDPSSSVSHFDTTLSPNELMEPFANSKQDRRLTTALFADIGWQIIPDSPDIQPAGTVLTLEDCSPGNGAVDPEETVTMTLMLRNDGSGVTQDLMATLQVGGGILAPSATQSYGALASGAEPVGRPFSFQADGACGGAIQASLRLRDGGVDLGLVTFAIRLGEITTATQSWVNAGSIQIPATGRVGPANPFPSTITVAGVTNPVLKIVVGLNGLSHAAPDDLDVLLVGPRGQKVILMSDTGGGSDLNNITLTLDDDAAIALPDATAITSGTYRPTNYGATDSFSSPAPGGPYQSSLSAFQEIDPNGVWSLYLQDDANPNTGLLSGGWSLRIFTETGAACCSIADQIADLALSSTAVPEPVTVGSNLVQTLTIRNHGPDPAAAVSLAGELSDALRISAVTPSQGSCSVSSGAVQCLLGNVTAGASVTVRLTGKPLSDALLTNRFTVTAKSTDLVPENDLLETVIPVNALPVLSSPPDLVLDEDTSSGPIALTIGDRETPAENLVISVRASNTALFPSQSISLGGTGSNRTITLLPAENLSGNSSILIRLTDANGASVGDAFLVAVTAVNDPPVLAPVLDQVIRAGDSLTLTNTATDVDIPINTLTFSLESGPIGASVDGITGIFSWTPEDTQANATYAVSVRVADNGTPSQGDVQSFTITVLGAPRVESIAVTENEVILVWQALAGQTYQVQGTAKLDAPEWLHVGDAVVATESSASTTVPRLESHQFYRVLLVEP